jgi:hypothetical protein
MKEVFKSRDISRSIRTLHRFLGLFAAPAIIFFAVSGALQTLSLHDATKDGAYRPPAWLLSMAQLHKKQTLKIVPKKASSSSSKDGSQTPAHGTKSTSSSSPSEAKTDKTSTFAMKAFFVLVSVTLVFSTISGLQIAWAFSKQRMLFLGILAAGIIIPVALLFI